MEDTTNNEETTRPACCVCAGSDTLCGVCEEILDRANMAETGRPNCRSCGEAPAGSGGICDACAPAEYHGYEADEEHLLYWDQHAEG